MGIASHTGVTVFILGRGHFSDVREHLSRKINDIKLSREAILVFKIRENIWAAGGTVPSLK